MTKEVQIIYMTTDEDKDDEDNRIYMFYAINDGKNLINLYMSTNSTDTSDEILFPFEIPNNFEWFSIYSRA